MLSKSDLDEVWFVVSPQNPFKEREGLLDDNLRLEMVKLAVEGNERFKVCDIEFGLPIPSYTIHTLSELKNRYEGHLFSLIMGGDNLASFDRWKCADDILENYGLYVYPRPGYGTSVGANHPHIKVVEVPMMDISSTHIRNLLKNGQDVRYLLPEAVYRYIVAHGLYAPEKVDF